MSYRRFVYVLRIATLSLTPFVLGSCATTDRSAAPEPTHEEPSTSVAPPEVDLPLRQGLPVTPGQAPCYASEAWRGTTTVHFHAIDLSEEEWARFGGREVVDDNLDLEIDEDAIPPRFARGHEYVVVGVDQISTARVTDFWFAPLENRWGSSEPWVTIELADPIDGLLLIVLAEHMPGRLKLAPIVRLHQPRLAHDNAERTLIERSRLDGPWDEEDLAATYFFMHAATLREAGELLAHGDILVPRPDYEEPDDEEGGCTFDWEIYHTVGRSAVIDEHGAVLRWVNIGSGFDLCIHDSSPGLTHKVDLDGDGFDDWIGVESCDGVMLYVWVRQGIDKWETIPLGYAN
ncbi:MAG: hypothetical protein R6X02_09095 [Enhygromyxa sp.]